MRFTKPAKPIKLANLTPSQREDIDSCARIAKVFREHTDSPITQEECPHVEDNQGCCHLGCGAILNEESYFNYFGHYPEKQV